MTICRGIIYHKISDDLLNLCKSLYCKLDNKKKNRLRGSGATAPVSSGSQAGVSGHGAGDGHAAGRPALPQQLGIKVGVPLGVFAAIKEVLILSRINKSAFHCISSRK